MSSATVRDNTTLEKKLFLRHISDTSKSGQVLQMTMVLPTFAETKVGLAAG